jgi:hypothetical protein
MAHAIAEAEGRDKVRRRDLHRWYLVLDTNGGVKIEKLDGPEAGLLSIGAESESKDIRQTETGQPKTL